MIEAEALSIACRKPSYTAACILRNLMGGVPRSDTVDNPAKNDVLKKWRDLEQQGRRSAVLANKGFPLGDSVSWTQHGLARFRQGYAGGDKRTNTTHIHPCLGSLFVLLTLTARTNRVALLSHLHYQKPIGARKRDRQNIRFGCTETTPSRDMLF
jgi:hypothetical protein